MTPSSHIEETRPAISVIIPAYNVGHYLAECLQSLIGQTFQDFEAIIVNDGSTDNTPQIIDRYTEADSRITSYSQDRQGAGIARNTGMAHARGSYLLFFDGDDIMMPDMLEKMFRRSTETDADVTVCYSAQFDDEHPEKEYDEVKPGSFDVEAVLSGDEYGEEVFFRFVGWPWDKLFKTEFVNEHGLEYQGLTSTNDAYFVFTALALAETIALVPECLACHRFHTGSIESTSHHTPHNVLKAYQAIEKRLLEGNASDELIKGCRNWGLSHLRWAIKRFSGNDEASNAAMEDYVQLLEEMDDKPDDYLTRIADKKIRSALSVMRSLSAERALIQLADEIENLEFEVSALQNDLKWTQQELEWSRETVQCRDEQIAALENSVSFKAGRIVTAAPRAVRDALAKPSKK